MVWQFQIRKNSFKVGCVILLNLKEGIRLLRFEKDV